MLTHKLKQIKTFCCLENIWSDAILSYNSEILEIGDVHVYVNKILKLGTIPQLKKTMHLKFCKRYLEISSKALNVASSSELGRFYH